MQVFFSIIIPTYNRAHILGRALEAILLQTFQDFEIVIADDGSTDNTREILKPYLEDKRIKYFFQQNKGVCAARNLGASNANGQYLVFLDSDDEVTENWLQDFHDVNSRDFDIVFCSMKSIEPNGTIKMVSCKNPYNEPTPTNWGISIPGCWAIKRGLFINSGMYDEKIKFGENTELRFRFQEKEKKIGLIDKYNLIYHKSSDGGSRNLENKLTSNLYVIDKHKPFFTENPEQELVFLKVAAVSAAKLGRFEQAGQLFKRAINIDKKNNKLWVQYFLTKIPFLCRLKWKVTG